MLGLTIYGFGAILFWPCAKYRSFAGFCICTFIVGLGLGTLEVSANPFLPIAIILKEVISQYADPCSTAPSD